MLSYPSLIDGRDVESDRHIYTVTTSSILDDVFGSLTLKRRLENGTADPDEAADFVVGRCAAADLETVTEAATVARRAGRRWSRVPLAERLVLGERIRARLVERHEKFIDILTDEGIPRALAEWQVAGLLEIFSPQTLGWCAAQSEFEFTEPNRQLRIRRVADGVVGINPPQNAPAASVLFGATALLAGNALVIRAPRSAPLGVMFVVREILQPALADVGAEPGLVNAFCSRPGPTIKNWLASPDIDDIFYTGGVELGLALERDCVANRTKPILELAGNDCVLVWKDADLDRTADALAECFFGSGQLCMVPNQVLVHPDVADDLLRRLSVTASLIRPGRPEDPGALLSPVLRSERFFGYLRDALDQGAQLVCGGRRVETDGSPSDTGMFLEPTVLRIEGLEHAREIEAVKEETFFPLLPVIVPDPAMDAELLEQMLEFIATNPYGLRNSVWAADPVVIDRCVAEIGNCGLLKINDSHLGFLPYLPSHGGTGRTGGAFGEANYPMLRTTHLQGVSIATDIQPRVAVFGAYEALRPVTATRTTTMSATAIARDTAPGSNDAISAG